MPDENLNPDWRYPTMTIIETPALTLASLRLVLVSIPGEGDELVSLALRTTLCGGEDLDVPPDVPRFTLGERQEQECRRVIREATEEVGGPGFPGWDKVFDYLDLMFPARPDKGFYCTTFCNFAHRLADGVPLNHECYVIPPLLLRLEMSGHPMMATEWHRWSCVNGRRFHGGVKTQGDDDLGLGRGGYDEDDDE